MSNEVIHGEWPDYRCVICGRILTESDMMRPIAGDCCEECYKKCKENFDGKDV